MASKRDSSGAVAVATRPSLRRNVAGLGVPGDLPREVARRLRVSNLYSLTAAALVVGVYAPLFYFAVESPALTWGALLVALGLSLVPVMHACGSVHAARYWMLLVSNAAILVYSLYLGPEAGVHLLFFVMACTPLTVLDRESRVGRAALAILPLLLLAGALGYGRLHGPRIVVPEAVHIAIEVSLNVTVLGLLATVVLYYLRLSERARHEVEYLHRVAKHELDEALRRSEARYGLAARGTRDGVWEWDLPADRLYCSPRWREIVGQPAKEATCRAVEGWLDRIHPDDHADVDAVLTAHIEGRSERLYCEYRLRHEDGGYRWVLTRGRAVRNARGDVTRMAGWMSDITEQRSAEQRLRQSEERFRQLVRQAADALLFLDEEGYILDANEQASRDLGFERAELIGRSPAEFDPGGVLGRSLRDLDALEATGHETLEAEFRRKDGSHYPVEVRVGIVRLDGARHVLTLARNIEKRRAMEAKLMFADRMVSVGTLAAGVAHEINNPLTYMGMNLEYLRAQEADLTRHLPPAQARRARQAISRALDGNARVATIVRDLKTFARGDAEDVELVNVNDVLESTLNLADGSVRRRAEVRADLQDVPGVCASESRLGQVFLNVLLNAAQALEGLVERKPVIRVTTRLVDDMVTVVIRDNGSGISAQNLSRIFDPFFTTKPVGVGTGLGLFICQNIVRSFGGEIDVESEPGKGTEVRLRLPAARVSRRGLAPANDVAV